MTNHEFVRAIWEQSYDYDKRMDIETATLDLRNFHDAEYDVPADLTPELYMEIWNDLVDEQSKGLEDKYWYAIMMDLDDQDWGTGTFDKEEAIRRVRDLRPDYPDAYIAVIQEGNDPICVEEIHDIQ